MQRERILNVDCLKLDKYFVDKLLAEDPNKAKISIKQTADSTICQSAVVSIRDSGPSVFLRFWRFEVSLPP